LGLLDAYDPIQLYKEDPDETLSSFHVSVRSDDFDEHWLQFIAPRLQ
jgi:hypothetical protein